MMLPCRSFSAVALAYRSAGRTAEQCRVVVLATISDAPTLALSKTNLSILPNSHNIVFNSTRPKPVACFKNALIRTQFHMSISCHMCDIVYSIQSKYFFIPNLCAPQLNQIVGSPLFKSEKYLPLRHNSIKAIFSYTVFHLLFNDIITKEVNYL